MTGHLLRIVAGEFRAAPFLSVGIGEAMYDAAVEVHLPIHTPRAHFVFERGPLFWRNPGVIDADADQHLGPDILCVVRSKLPTLHLLGYRRQNGSQGEIERPSDNVDYATNLGASAWADGSAPIHSQNDVGESVFDMPETAYTLLSGSAVLSRDISLRASTNVICGTSSSRHRSKQS